MNSMPAFLRVLLGAGVIAVAGLYPLWAVFRLNRRLSRPDGPDTWTLVWWLVFTLSFPFALALVGAGIVAPRLGTSPVFWASIVGFAFMALVGGVGYWLHGRRSSST